MLKSAKVQGRIRPVLRRMGDGIWGDGFIHAGNLAYMSIFAIFPFFIIGAAGLSLLGRQAAGAASLAAVLSTLPPNVREVIEPVVRGSIASGGGWVLWSCVPAGMWTVGSLIEALREILRRAYGVEKSISFLRSRLASTGIILLAMLLLILSLFAQVAIGTLQGVAESWFPELARPLSVILLSRLVPACILFAAVLMLYVGLTPSGFRAARFPKWPGALLFSLWAGAVTIALPKFFQASFTYDLIYGSLAGIMIVLFFFWLIGLGMVVGGQLNAALALEAENELANTPAQP